MNELNFHLESEIRNPEENKNLTKTQSVNKIR